MAKRISKEDRAVIAGLVERYSAPALVNAVRRIGARAPGRPAEVDPYDAVRIWIAVEVRRRGSTLKVRPACELVHSTLVAVTVPPHVDAGRVRALYYEARRRLCDDEALRERCEAIVTACLAEGQILVPSRLRRRATGDWQGPIID